MTRNLLERCLDVANGAPTRPALVSRERTVAYDELVAMIGAAGARLGDLGRPGDRVAVLAENSAEYVAATYGSWSAHLAVVGLNPALRAEELAPLIRHAGARATLVDPEHPEVPALRDRLAGVGPLLSLRDVTTPDASVTRASPRPDAGRPDDLAAIVYTSGTTGHPKGVMLSHRNLAANTASIQEALPIRPDDRALCVLPFQYSYGASVLHTHLSLGATVLVERSLMYPRRVLERADTERATSLAGVPSTFYLLLDRTDLDSYDLASLRYVTQAGGRMDPARIQAFRKALPHVRFIVMYGQTEAAARLACLPPEDLDAKLGSAGRAIPGVALEIRADDGTPAAPHQLGEVWARGENVMMGYWADPEETKSVLVDGWLRTGDVGSMDPEGFLFLEGRSRDLIKSGAYRIAPAELEDVIRAVGGVIDVAVVGREDPVLGEAIHAHVIATSPGDALARDIKRRCLERLARFKLPKHIHFRDDFPRTASGKVQKHLL